jgi:hypothetical protein
MSGTDHVRVENVEIGVDSNSGKSFNVKIDGLWLWCPYSVIRKREINQQVHGEDAIEVERWWLEHNEVSAA